MRFTNFFGLGYSVQFKCACSEEEQNQFDRKEDKEVTISVVFLFNYKISEIKKWENWRKTIQSDHDIMKYVPLSVTPVMFSALKGHGHDFEQKLCFCAFNVYNILITHFL